MKDWIISVSAVVIITAIVTLILPEGKMGKYVKSIFCILILLTIIKPLVFLKDLEFNYESILTKNAIVLQEDFIGYTLEKQVNQTINKCKNLLEDIGVNDPTINIDYTIDSNFNPNIRQVIVNLKNSVIISDKEHIDIIKEVKNIISSYLFIEKNLVMVYE